MIKLLARPTLLALAAAITCLPAAAQSNAEIQKHCRR